MAHTLGVSVTPSLLTSSPAIITLNGTTAGRSLILALSWTNSSVTISSVTCNGEANLTAISTPFVNAALFGGEVLQFFYLSNITTGGNKTITVTFSTDVTCTAAAYEFSGGNVSDWYDAGTIATATGSSTTATCTVTTGSANDLIIAIVAAENSDPTALGASYVVITIANPNDFVNGEYNLDVGVAGAKTVSMDVAGGGDWSIIAAAFKTIATPPPPVELMAGSKVFVYP